MITDEIEKTKSEGARIAVERTISCLIEKARSSLHDCTEANFINFRMKVQSAESKIDEAKQYYAALHKIQGRDEVPF